MVFFPRNKASFRKYIVLPCIAVLFCGQVFAALKGNYTINRNAPASATNYLSFSSWISDLTTGLRKDSFAANGPGISGKVVLTVIKGSGPYNEQISLPEISGSSAANPIIIKGNNELLTYNTNSSAIPVVSINGADHIYIDSLHIQASGTSFGRCIEVMNESNYIYIEHCRLEMPNMTGTSDYNGYIMVTNGTTRPSVYTNPGKEIFIRNNFMGSGINRGPYYGIWLSQVQGSTDSSGYIIANNEIRDVYYAFIYASYTVATRITGNKLHNSGHNRQGYIYGIYLYNYLTRCDAIINGNRMYELNNTSTGAYDGRYPVYVYMYASPNTRELEITNNILDLRCTYYTPGIYVYALNASHTGVKFYYNTLNFDGKVKNTYAYGLYMTQMYYADVDFKNNIFHCNWELSGPIYAIYFVPGTIKFDHNLMYLSDISGSGSVYYGYNGSSHSTLKNWASAVNGLNNLEENPLLNDPDNGQWFPQSFRISNKGIPVSVNTDLDGRMRHTVSPDLGAIEYSLDLSLLQMVTTDSNVCSNEPVGVKVLVKNLSQFTLRQVPLSVGINNDTSIHQIFNVKLDPGDSVWLTFNTSAFFHSGANSFLITRLNGMDDQLSNNSLNLIIHVRKAPAGGSIDPLTPFEGYIFTGDKSNPDIAIPGNKLNYEIRNPIDYDNVRYDSTWKLNIVLKTLGGTIISKGWSFSPPGTSKNAQITFNPDKSLEDSIVLIEVRTSSIITGCDTVFGRYLFIHPAPVAGFTVSDICLGDVAEFENTTQVTRGELLYFWDFGDSFSYNDTSAGYSPIYIYSKEGIYTVNLLVKLKKYPKFSFGISRNIVVNPMPLVDFMVQNACEGNPVMFFNQTKINGGNPSFAKYSWDFGDNKGTSGKFSPDYKYTEPGGYKVTLHAEYEGCKSSIVKNANQFAMPSAFFRLAGSCSKTAIQFTNESTIKTGKSGYVWDFGDGTQSFLFEPTHVFDVSGNFATTLTAISEFGCADTFTKNIELKESPEALFEFSEACGNLPVKFQNKSTFPAGYSAESIWDFNGEMFSTDWHGEYQFNGLGARYVNLKIKSGNGCENNITQYPVIRRQPKADFSTSDVCEGEAVSFTNKSTVDYGDISYEWRFGDNSFSNLTSPKKFYTIQGTTATFLVTLMATVNGGCADSITRPVTVNAKTNATFDANVSGRFVQFIPKVLDETFSYNWNFGEGSRSNHMQPLHEYSNIDQGIFEACLGIINAAGCLSESCREVGIDLVGTDKTTIDHTVLFPNPASDFFIIKNNLNSFPDSYIICDHLGRILQSDSWPSDGFFRIGELSKGLYQVSGVNEGRIVFSESFVVVGK